MVKSSSPTGTPNVPDHAEAMLQGCMAILFFWFLSALETFPTAYVLMISLGVVHSRVPAVWALSYFETYTLIICVLLPVRALWRSLWVKV